MKYSVKEKQQRLAEIYSSDASKAWITDMAVIQGQDLHDPFHNTVIINEEIKIPFRAGVHHAVGGLNDLPNPGDLLCASLAVCFESTLRMIANRLNIKLLKTLVKVTAEVDVRGTLVLDKSIPVGFQKMTIALNIATDRPDFEPTLIKATEYSCIVYQTIRKGIPIEVINQPVLEPVS
ncbi:OsmC family protein [Echinicola sp. 20G]|uniref:OsmC family protein n=1 Tax=Echinicola sp. 20G TaxID=2781961 RepID=UPI001910945A|nr:OsmC family protein [Echinicola sp. 20G]